ncbi:MAG TPA: response regulator [Planctomycetota bacterium]|nr:response regulator [Planctomycetota bacterium]
MTSTRGALVVVNDDPTQLRLACALLERQGYRVHAAAGAAEALRVLEQHPGIQGIVTDLHMPEIDGWRLCRLLRSPAYAHLNRLPILVLSATFSGEDAEHITKELGANAFLAAPYQPAALARQVAGMLDGDAPPLAPSVLLVQPDGERAARLAELFASHGYAVHVTREPEEALDVFHREETGIVVADAGPAVELLPHFKRPGGAAVVLVTAPDHDPRRALELARLGADAYVQEEYEPEFLVAIGERARRQRALLRVEELLEERTLLLRSAERRLRALFRAFPEILLVYRRDGRILQANPAAAGALERGSASLVGSDVRTLVAPDMRADFAARIARLDSAGPRRYEMAFLAADGRRLDAEVTDSLVTLDDSDVILCVARDIGAQRRAGKERALLAAAVQQAGEMIVVAGIDGRIRYVNPAFEHITGYTREEVIGASIDVLHGEEESQWRDVLAKVAGGASWRGRMRRRRKDGRPYVSEGTVSPVRDDSEGVRYYVVVEQDVTSEEELEDALRQAQKMEAIGTLAGGIAHDFNNLLTGILGYANLIATMAPDGEMGKMAKVIEGSAERCAHLTKELLGFARRGKNRNVPVDVNETVGHVAHLVSRSLGGEIRLATRIEADAPTVRGDPSQIEQSLMNLVINARDALAGRKEGEIAVATRTVAMDRDSCARHPGLKPGPCVLVTVTDNGCGMPREVQARIFEPFFTTKPRGEGTGLGLSMTYGIVKNHGGSIGVYSEVDRGTTFNVYLPIDEEAAASAPVIAAATEVIKGTGRILVVDDEEVVRTAAAAMLRHLGYEVVALADGEEAVLYYRHFGDRIDLVLLDMVMPKMGGRETLKALRGVSPGVKVVLSTGFGLNEAAQAILDEGAIGFAQKPYRASDLSQVVAAALRGERVAR